MNCPHLLFLWQLKNVGFSKTFHTGDNGHQDQWGWICPAPERYKQQMAKAPSHIRWLEFKKKSVHFSVNGLRKGPGAKCFVGLPGCSLSSSLGLQPAWSLHCIISTKKQFCWRAEAPWTYPQMCTLHPTEGEHDCWDLVGQGAETADRAVL